MLRSVGLEFEVIPSEAEEVNHSDSMVVKQVKEWAREKAWSVGRMHPRSWVLGADTVVVLGGRIFGKPRDPLEAKGMLGELSGRTHEVISGVCLVCRQRDISRIQSVITRVHFRSITAREIDAYVNTGEPLDKAGAYGIQGRGACLVQAVSGSYTNVVGLPLWETLCWLLELEVIEPAVLLGGPGGNAVDTASGP